MASIVDLQGPVAAMDAHLHPNLSKLKYKYELITDHRKPAESITAFVTCLQSLNNYASKNRFIVEMFRDAFVLGINNAQIRFRRKTNSLCRQQSTLLLRLNYCLQHKSQKSG